MDEKQYASKLQEEYSEKVPGDVDKLKKLDEKVKLPANIFAYTFGVIGALVLGVGMCLAMKVIGDMFALGIVVGIVGIVMVSANYFIYKAILKSRKNKYASEVISLSNNIIGE